jgi:predicted transposase YdaD
LDEEEIIQMLDKILEEEEDWFTNSLYMRRLHERWRQEGREEGREEGRIEGLRDAILESIKIRFDPPISVYESIQYALRTCQDARTLQQLLVQVIKVQQLDEFIKVLSQEGQLQGA